MSNTQRVVSDSKTSVFNSTCRGFLTYPLEPQVEDMSTGWKVFNDSVHGHIKLHPVCVQIIDTPEFQRLRNVKQCGSLYSVFPGASHNRFEHSLGVCYLAGQMVEALRRNCYNEIISDDEKLCLEIAGLCHDLGHGPLSHTWEKFVKVAMKRNGDGDADGWRHEDSTIAMLEYLMAKNNDKLKNILTKSLPDLTARGIDCIKYIEDLILGKKNTSDAKKTFLYEIVSNKENGIDVDRWDYFLRDGLQLNFKITFDYRRLLEFCRVIDVNGENRICFSKKEAQHIYDMFLVRAKLHNRAYGHDVVKSIEEMFIDVFLAADDEGYKIQIPSGETFKLSEAHKNVKALSCMTDHIIFNILYDPNCPKGRALLERILNRDLYTFVCRKNFSIRLTKALQELESCSEIEEIRHKIREEMRTYKQETEEEIEKICRSTKYYTVKHFYVEMTKIDMGIELNKATLNSSGKINPFSNIYFYDKKDVHKAVPLEWEEVPLFPIPEDSIYRIDGIILYKNDQSLKNNKEAMQELNEIRSKLRQC